MMERIVFEYLVNSVWQLPMLAAMAWLLIRLGRPSVQVQHVVWLGTLMLAVLLPLHGMDAVGGLDSQAILSGTAQEMGTVSVSENSIGVVPPINLAGTTANATDEQRAAHMQTEPLLVTRRVRLSRSAMDCLLALYFLAILFRLVRLGCAWRAARRLVAHARQATFSQPESAMLRQLCDELGVVEPEILVSGEIVSPLTLWGARPVLVLPDSFHEFPVMEMTAMLCHELIHVRRRDYWMNLACQAGALPIAYHPVTYAVQRRVRQTREMVCDELAADTMQSASGYARCLLALAERMFDGRGFVEQTQAVGLFDNNVLEERIMRLVETRTKMSVRARIIRTAAGTILMTAGIAAATVLHVTPTVVHAANRPVPAMQAVISQTAPTGTAAAPQADTTAATEPSPTTESTPSPAPQEEVAPNPEQAPQVNPQPVAPADVQPISSSAPSSPTPPEVAPPSQVVPDGEHHPLTPEERAQLEAQLAAVREQMRSEMKVLHSPEFKQQMDAMRQQLRDAMRKQRSAERQHRMQMKESPQFKQQMAEARQQMDAARRKMRTAARQQRNRTGNVTDSATFKQQMAEAQQQMAAAIQKLQSTEMQQRMQMKESPEFEQQMEAARKQFQDAMQKLQSDAMQRQLQILRSPEFKQQIEQIEKLRQQLRSDEIHR